jgi:hypothetical protein
VRRAGLKLTGQISDINAQSTLLTSDYQRKYSDAARKKKYLEDNKIPMVALAAVGGAPALGLSFYNAGKESGWWGE